MEPDGTVCHENSKTFQINHRKNLPFMQTQLKCISMWNWRWNFCTSQKSCSQFFIRRETDIDFALLHLPTGCCFSLNACLFSRAWINAKESKSVRASVYGIYSWCFRNWEIISKFVPCVPVYWIHNFCFTFSNQYFSRADDATVIVVWIQCFNFVFDDIMGLYVCSTKWLSN